jgi:hypothetical protein
MTTRSLPVPLLLLAVVIALFVSVPAAGADSSDFDTVLHSR